MFSRPLLHLSRRDERAMPLRHPRRFDESELKRQVTLPLKILHMKILVTCDLKVQTHARHLLQRAAMQIQEMKRDERHQTTRDEALTQITLT